jgi:hypothetical protein
MSVRCSKQGQGQPNVRQHSKTRSVKVTPRQGWAVQRSKGTEGGQAMPRDIHCSYEPEVIRQTNTLALATFRLRFRFLGAQISWCKNFSLFLGAQISWCTNFDRCEISTYYSLPTPHSPPHFTAVLHTIKLGHISLQQLVSCNLLYSTHRMYYRLSPRNNDTAVCHSENTVESA